MEQDRRVKNPPRIEVVVGYQSSRVMGVYLPKGTVRVPGKRRFTGFGSWKRSTLRCRSRLETESVDTGECASDLESGLESGLERRNSTRQSRTPLFGYSRQGT